MIKYMLQSFDKQHKEKEQRCFIIKNTLIYEVRGEKWYLLRLRRGQFVWKEFMAPGIAYARTLREDFGLLKGLKEGHYD